VISKRQKAKGKWKTEEQSKTGEKDSSSQPLRVRFPAVTGLSLVYCFLPFTDD
jgi:hypothetical protein